MARVLLFGRFADVAGWREREFDVVSLGDLRVAILTSDRRLYDALHKPATSIAVDKVLVRADVSLTATSEVAFLPPMSGG